MSFNDLYDQAPDPNAMQALARAYQARGYTERPTELIPGGMPSNVEIITEPAKQPPPEPIKPRIQIQKEVQQPQQQPQAQPQQDPWGSAGFSSAPPQEPKPQPTPGKPGGDPWASAGFSAAAPKESEQAPSRNVSGTEAAGRGALNALTFGAAPAISGLSEAGGTARSRKDVEADQQGVTIGDLLSPIKGAWKMIQGDHGANEAYHRGREASLADEKLAQEQHPHAFLLGQLAGSLATPGFGAARAGTAAQRVLSGVRAGAIGGGLTGAGTAISENKDAPDAILDTAQGAATGGALGGVLGGVLGPRLRNPASPGARAAQTAEDLGAPLPRGVASDNRGIQGSAAKLQALPFVGSRIGRRVGETAEAAGRRVEDISGQMRGPVEGRAAADTVVRPGLQNVIDANRQTINQNYGAVRSQIDQNQRFTMPRTDAALNAIMRERQAAGHTNPAQGLEQFRNVAGGATFNGAHRARVDAREAGNPLVPHPGYNRADYNRLTRAMTADLRAMVQAAAHTNPQRALRAFDQAEQEFGRLADQNDRLHRLINSQGEGAIGTLLGAAREKGGDLRLLAQLRASMHPDDFAVIGGTLLHELAANPTTGEFSLAKFATGWRKISDRSKAVMFSPEHLRNINDIAAMGQHIKGALRETNTSHTAGVLVLFDLAKDAALLGADLAEGEGPGTKTAAGAGTTVALGMFTLWLARPARAAAMANWLRAYQGVAASRTPARLAAFNLATRNLANNLEIPMNRVADTIGRALPGRADQQAGEEQ